MRLLDINATPVFLKRDLIFDVAELLVIDWMLLNHLNKVLPIDVENAREFKRPSTERIRDASEEL